jgi:iron(III) transport system substrate-binding protein
MFFATAFAANAKETVTVYTEREPQFIQPVLERFTKSTGIDVDVVYEQSDLVERIQSEGRATDADVLIAVNVGRLVEAAGAGIAAPITSRAVLDNIPASYRDKGGLWVGLTMRARVLITPRKPGDDQVLTSYEGLADPIWKGAICMRSGYHVYNTGLIASMIAHHGEDYTRDWLRYLKSNLARKPQGKDRDQIAAVASGECRIGIANSYYYGKMLDDPEKRAAASKVQITFPNQETFGTHVNITGVVMMANAPHAENALQLIEFMASSDIQHVYADANFEYPVGVVWPEKLRSWGDFKAEQLPLTVIAGYQELAKQLLDEVAFDD